MLSVQGPNGRVAVVDGVRTPFGKAGGELAPLSGLDLATLAVSELAGRNGLGGGDVDSLVLGSVLLPEDAPYLARQVALALGWPDIDAHSAEYACATGARAVVNGAYQILTGEHAVVLAGGSESLSQRPLYAPPAVRDAVLGRREEPEVTEILARTLGDVFPGAPQVIEPYSGRTLLAHTEDMVREWDVSREESDELAVRSHGNAARAWDEGRLDGEVMAVQVNGTRIVRDGLVRGDATLAAAGAMHPAEPGGTITAANASRLTDGGSAVLLMSERAAEAAGKTPRGFLRAWAFTGQDPALGALIGPTFALSAALRAAGLDLADLDLIDLHEAFTGQVAVNLRALASDEFARAHLARERAVGVVELEQLNVNGGSVALGHPFGATGGRLVTQSLNELGRRSGAYSAIAFCAGGARGAALVFSRS